MSEERPTKESVVNESISVEASTEDVHEVIEEQAGNEEEEKIPVEVHTEEKNEEDISVEAPTEIQQAEILPAVLGENTNIATSEIPLSADVIEKTNDQMEVSVESVLKMLDEEDRSNIAKPGPSTAAEANILISKATTVVQKDTTEAATSSEATRSVKPVFINFVREEPILLSEEIITISSQESR